MHCKRMWYWYGMYWFVAIMYWFVAIMTHQSKHFVLSTVEPLFRHAILRPTYPEGQVPTMVGLCQHQARSGACAHTWLPIRVCTCRPVIATPGGGVISTCATEVAVKVSWSHSPLFTSVHSLQRYRGGPWSSCRAAQVGC